MQARARETGIWISVLLVFELPKVYTTIYCHPILEVYELAPSVEKSQT